MSPDDDRLAALERQVAALSAEVARLRHTVHAGESMPAPHRDAFARASAAASSIGEDEIESIVGRYGTLLLGAFVLLMGVGVLIQFAVARGLLTPAVRVGLGAMVAAAVGAAGLWFHHRGEVRFANVLLALALALVDLVAWGAGPRLQLVPTLASLVVVDVVAVALAVLALRDESEFLFSVAVGGALSAPFVTREGVTSPDVLLAYGGVVLIGSLRAARDPRWQRAFVLLVGGALVYALAAIGTPSAVVASWPFAVSAFAGACAAGALLFAHPAWRGSLARAFLAVGLVGIPAAWDRIPGIAPVVTWATALTLAGVTYVALWFRRGSALWTASALLLPCVSLGLAAAWSTLRMAEAAVVALWAVFALSSWRAERMRAELDRGGAHLAAGGLMGAAAAALLSWPSPLVLTVALVACALAASWAVRDERRLLPLIAVALPLGCAALSAIDQLVSQADYSYVPFTTRSSASALVVTLGIGAVGLVLRGGNGAAARRTDEAVRLGVLIGFAILWGRMEIAGGWNPDLSAFLLTAYYAACGLASIIAGRRHGVGRLRLAGLALAIYAAVKALLEASVISELLLRVGAYGAVGVFLLAAGYTYREAGAGRE